MQQFRLDREEAPAGPILSVDYWAKELQRQRSCGGAANSPFDADAGRLRGRFARLNGRWHALRDDPRLGAGGLPPLSRIAAYAAALGRLLHDELEGVRAEPRAAGEAVRRLLSVFEQTLDRLRGQLRLIDEVRQFGDLLHEAVDELLHSPSVPPVRFQNLARRIINSTAAASPPTFIPEPGLSLAESTEPRKRLADPYVYTAGVQAARLIAAAVAPWPTWQSRLEWLTVAGLLHDAGLLVFDALHPCRPAQLERLLPDVYEQHPAAGSALAAGLREYSAVLPAAVAQHHERLDGTGFPRGLRSWQVSPPARLLAVVVRFLELAENVPAGPVEVGSPWDTCRAAALQLQDEALHGELDGPLSARFLQSLHTRLSSGRAEDQFADVAEVVRLQGAGASWTEVSQLRLRIRR